MVILFIRRDGHLGHHEVFHHDTIEIGRAASNDLVLDHFRIARNHATLIAGDGLFALEPRPTTARHERRDPPRIVIDGHVLRLPGHVIELEHYTEPTEIALLCQIELGDDSLREVYADWLEQRDELAKAMLLRAQLALRDHDPSSPEFDALAERTYALAGRVPAGWRSCVAHSMIEIGDDRLGLGLLPAPEVRRITGEPYATLQLTIGGERLAATQVFVPALVAELRRTLDQLMRLPELTTELSCGVPDGVRVLAHRDGDQAALRARRGDATVEARLPMPELRARIDRLIELVAGS